MSHVISIIGALVVTGAIDLEPVSPEQQVRQADAGFWQAFNSCDRPKMAALLSPDVEFYHDKTGTTIGRNKVVRSLIDGPCGTPGLHVRREEVATSVSFDPVPGFGGILTGRHRFHARQGDRAEVLDGEARFAIVWRIGDGHALIHRVLSFAHGPAHDVADQVSAPIPMAVMQAYVGRYATPMGEIDVTMADGRLSLTSGKLATELFAITPTTFQSERRPLRFEFVVQAGKAVKIQVRENGSLVAEGERLDTGSPIIP